MTSSMSGSWIERSATSYADCDRRHDRRGAGVGGERQPLARALDLAHLGAGHVDGRRPRRRGRRRACGVEPPWACSPASEPSYTDRAVVDHDHPVAQRLDVLQVVRGEQQRGAALGVERAEELAQPALADHVEPDGGLVEVDHLRVVEQGGGDVAAHPLAEAELAHRACRAGRRGRAARRSGRGSRGSAPAGCGTSSAAGRRSRAAAGPTTASSAGRRRRRSAAPARRAARLGSSPATRTCPPVGHEDAGEHLDRRRLPGAVGADVADHLAGARRRR